MKNKLHDILTRAGQEKKATSLALCIRQGNQLIFDDYVGADENSLFDLASLTKILFTTTFCAVKADQANLRLEQKLYELDSDFDFIDCTVLDLLTHQAGFQSWCDFEGVRDRDILQKIRNLPRQHASGLTTVYSDVGFILLGLYVKKMFSQTYEQMFASLYDASDGLVIWDQIDENQRKRIIPTGYSQKRKNIDGSVNDDNTYFLGGLQPHAGLFGTAHAVHDALSYWRDESKISKKTRDRFFQPVCAQDGSQRALGWDIPSPNSTAGQNVPESAVGHLGYTGTSVWMDPKTETTITFLTNRTYCQTSKEDMNILRQQIHDVVWSQL